MSNKCKGCDDEGKRLDELREKKIKNQKNQKQK